MEVRISGSNAKKKGGGSLPGGWESNLHFLKDPGVTVWRVIRFLHMVQNFYFFVV